MTDYTVFISSSDNYSDLWDLFFDLFKKKWPDFKGDIVLNTQKKEFSFPGLNISCTKVGCLNGFGSTLRAGLDKVKTDHILFFLIDFILMGEVKSEKLDEYYNYYLKNNLDSLCLVYKNLPMAVCNDYPEISRYLPSNHYFNYQVAFWKKEILKEMALPHENPWSSEWYGNKRALEAKLDIRTINDANNDVFIYNRAGCLQKGKWLPDAVEFLSANGYDINFERRGYYESQKHSLIRRIRMKWTFVLHGIKGSYWCKINS